MAHYCSHHLFTVPQSPVSHQLWAPPPALYDFCSFGLTAPPVCSHQRVSGLLHSLPPGLLIPNSLPWGTCSLIASVFSPAALLLLLRSSPVPQQSHTAPHLCCIEHRRMHCTRGQAWEHPAFESKLNSKEQSTKLPRRDGLKTSTSGQVASSILLVQRSAVSFCFSSVMREEGKVLLPLQKRRKKKCNPPCRAPAKPKASPSPSFSCLPSSSVPAGGQLFSQSWDLAAVTERTQPKSGSELMYLQQRDILMTPGFCNHPFISARTSTTGERLR